MKVEFIVEYKEGHGYRKAQDLEETTEIRFTVDASCYVNAKRAVEPLINWNNVAEFDSVCIE